MNSDLFAGIAKGLQSGAESYLSNTRANEEQALKKRLADAGLAKEGLMVDPESGVIVRTPESIATKAREVEKYGLESEKTKAEIEKLKHEAAKPYTKESNPLADEMRQARLSEMARKKEEASFKKTPKGRLEAGGAELKQKIGFLTGGLKSLTDYENAYSRGERQGYITPQMPLVGGLISSTPIDDSRVQLEESIGRLASGAAITANEESRFRNMIPKAGDKDEAAARKIKLLRQEMENKMQAYGFSPGDMGSMGFDPATRGYPEGATSDEPRGLMGDAKPGLMGAGAAGGAPKPGTIQDGHRYLGGDPADPKSWEMVK